MYLLMIAVALAIFWIRGVVLIDTTPAPHTALAGLDFVQRLATFCTIVVEWTRLFVWPVRLIPVYSPPYIDAARSFDASAVPGFLIILISITLAALASRRRSSHAITLGFEWLAVSLLPVSNILFATGIIVAERTLFLPSVGFAIIAGIAAHLALERARGRRWIQLLQISGAALLAAALVRGAVHERVWSDDGHLVTAAIVAAPDSYMLDAMYADYALRSGKPDVAEQWLKRAIELYPRDPSPHISLGQLYVQAGRFDDALLAFSIAMGLDRENSDARAGMILCLDRLGRYRDAHLLARTGIAMGGEESGGFRRLLAITDSLGAAAKAAGAASTPAKK
jgi:tetratricopeptide (TPR) repeat protein